MLTEGENAPGISLLRSLFRPDPFSLYWKLKRFTFLAGGSNMRQLQPATLKEAGSSMPYTPDALPNGLLLPGIVRRSDDRLFPNYKGWRRIPRIEP
jgi:hypothetical protein